MSSARLTACSSHWKKRSSQSQRHWPSVFLLWVPRTHESFFRHSTARCSRRAKRESRQARKGAVRNFSRKSGSGDCSRNFTKRFLRQRRSPIPSGAIRGRSSGCHYENTTVAILENRGTETLATRVYRLPVRKNSASKVLPETYRAKINDCGSTWYVSFAGDSITHHTCPVLRRISHSCWGQKIGHARSSELR
jgi:hypothetical protein